MTDTPAVNDIPEILARAELTKLDASRSIERVGTLGTLLRTDVPNMAAEITRLRGENTQLKEIASDNFDRYASAQERLDVLEETFREGRIWWVTSPPFNPAWALGDQLPAGRRRTRYFPTLTEAVDAELLSRREKEHG